MQSESNAQTGSSFDDLNGYTISLSARSAFLPFEVTKETVDALVDATV